MVMPLRAGNSLILSIPIIWTNGFKYLFETFIVSSIVGLITTYIGKLYIQRELQKNGHISIKEGAHESRFLPSAPRTKHAAFAFLIIHAFMFEFQLSFDSTTGVRGIPVPVKYPSLPRTSGISSSIWTEAASRCCTEPNGDGLIKCSRPVKIVGIQNPESNPLSRHALSDRGYWTCQGDTLGQVKTTQTRHIEVTVVSEFRENSKCSATKATGINITLCGLGRQSREDIITFFENDLISPIRDRYVEFRRYYVSAGLWDEGELLRENATLYNREYAKTVIHPTVAGVLALLILFLGYFASVRWKGRTSLIWGMDLLIRASDDTNRRPYEKDSAGHVHLLFHEREAVNVKVHTALPG